MNQPNNKTNQSNNKSKLSSANTQGTQNKLSNANAKGGANPQGGQGCSENFCAPAELSARPYCTNPETCEEMLNTFGTYNIQPTANTDNEFPAIAQGSARQSLKNLKTKK